MRYRNFTVVAGFDVHCRVAVVFFLTASPAASQINSPPDKLRL